MTFIFSSYHAQLVKKGIEFFQEMYELLTQNLRCNHIQTSTAAVC